MRDNNIRFDHLTILDFIKSHSSVLDIGCGTGELLYLLDKEKNARTQGIEIDEQAIYACVAKGVNVFHGDIDSGLAEYKDKSFDYVILNQSLQQVRHVKPVLEDALRVGVKVIVGFPNFAFYKARIQMFFSGRTPVTDSLPYQWYETPNLHFLSILDFKNYCRENRILIEKARFITGNREVVLFPNFFAQTGIFIIQKYKPKHNKRLPV